MAESADSELADSLGFYPQFLISIKRDWLDSAQLESARHSVSIRYVDIKKSA